MTEPDDIGELLNNPELIDRITESVREGRQARSSGAIVRRLDETIEMPDAHTVTFDEGGQQ